MKKLLAAASIAGGMWLGLAAPAGAIVIVGSGGLGGPDTRVGVEVKVDPWDASRTGLLGCVADGLFQPCVAESGRS